CGVTSSDHLVCWGDPTHPAIVAGLPTLVVDAVAVGRAVCWIDVESAVHCVGEGASELFTPPTDFLPDEPPVAVYGGWSDTACIIISRFGGAELAHRCWGPEPLGGNAFAFARSGSAGQAHVCSVSTYQG